MISDDNFADIEDDDYDDVDDQDDSIGDNYDIVDVCGLFIGWSALHSQAQQEEGRHKVSMMSIYEQSSK